MTCDDLNQYETLGSELMQNDESYITACLWIPESSCNVYQPYSDNVVSSSSIYDYEDFTLYFRNHDHYRETSQKIKDLNIPKHDIDFVNKHYNAKTLFQRRLENKECNFKTYMKVNDNFVFV